MSLNAALTNPIYTGVGLAADVPSKWDVALNGRTYMIDTDPRFPWKRESISLLKPQQDTSGVVAEASLNPEEFARRAQESWHGGAGQEFLDRPESDPNRFSTSKGVDIWTRYQLSLLNATELISSSTNSNLRLAVAGARLAFIDGTSAKYTDDLSTVSTYTGTAGWLSLTSDGNYFYGTDGTDVYRWDAAATAVGSAWNTLDCDLIQFVKGRLMAAHDDAIYNITSSAAPTAITVAAGTVTSAFRWIGFASGNSCIYAAGFQGDKSLIFRVGIKDDATGLDVAVQAGELPDGEIVRSIYSYLGFLCIGTDTGLRFAVADTNGDLTIGARIPASSPVQCFEGQDRFVWYGLSNYDSTSSGLGRLDLTRLNDSAPAYASDVMATAQGAVLSVVTMDDKRVFAVSGSGIWKEDDVKVASGELVSSRVTYGLPDEKLAVNLTVTHQPLEGQVSVYLAANDGAYALLTTNDVAGSVNFTSYAGQTRGETFRVKLTIGGDLPATTAAPVLNRWTLEANPSPGRGEFFLVPLRLFSSVDTATGKMRVDTRAEYEALIAMEADGGPVVYQDAGGTLTVFLDDHEFHIHGHNNDRSFLNGTFVCRLRRPRRRS